MYIINAPLLFTGMWNIVKMCMAEKTREKVVILGSNYLTTLKEIVKYLSILFFYMYLNLKVFYSNYLD